MYDIIHKIIDTINDIYMLQGSVARLAEQQLPSGVTGVRSLPAAPLRCGCVISVLNSLVG